MEKIEIHRILVIFDKYLEPKTGITSLCSEMHLLLASGEIEPDEHWNLHQYFKSQKPTWYRNIRFYLSKQYTGQNFWWDKTNVILSTQQRKLFIKYLIKKTRP